MTMTPASETPDTEVIALRPSPWEEAAKKADRGEVAHLSDDTGEHRYVVLTEEQYLALEEALEDAAEDRWLAEEIVPKIHESRSRRAAGERGIPMDELMAQLDAADVQ